MKQKISNTGIVKKSSLLFVVLLMVCSVENFGQLHSISVYGELSNALNSSFRPASFVNDDLKIQRADAKGGSVSVRYNVIEHFNVSLSAGFKLYSISQDSAVEKWNWKFWDLRYKGNVRDALNSDSTLKAIIYPIQRTETYPVFIVLGYNPWHNDDWEVSVQYGIGVIFYYRKLTLSETWMKYFKQVGYQFSYSYQNFAPSKVGNPVASNIALQATYKFSESFGVTASAQYLLVHNVFNTGYENFPFRRAIESKLGLTIFY